MSDPVLDTFFVIFILGELFVPVRQAPARVLQSCAGCFYYLVQTEIIPTLFYVTVWNGCFHLLQSEDWQTSSIPLGLMDRLRRETGQTAAGKVIVGL